MTTDIEIVHSVSHQISQTKKGMLWSLLWQRSS